LTRKTVESFRSHVAFPSEGAAVARVTELGGRAAIPADSASGRSVTVCDDQGVSFSLWTPAEGY
jgi:hypothetical protein